MKSKRRKDSRRLVTSPTLRGLLFQRIIEQFVALSPAPIERLVLPLELYSDMGMPALIAALPHERVFVHVEPVVELWVEARTLTLRIPSDLPEEELIRCSTDLPASVAQAWKGFCCANSLIQQHN